MNLQSLPIRDGETYDHERDGARLNRQAHAVYALMRDQRWRTLAEIAERLGEPEASVSARLRDLRKEKFGGFLVEREYLDSSPAFGNTGCCRQKPKRKCNSNWG